MTHETDRESRGPHLAVEMPGGSRYWPICRGCKNAYSPDAFGALPWVGTQDNGLGGLLELRDCDCGSTISRPLK